MIFVCHNSSTLITDRFIIQNGNFNIKSIPQYQLRYHRILQVLNFKKMFALLISQFYSADDTSIERRRKGVLLPVVIIVVVLGSFGFFAFQQWDVRGLKDVSGILNLAVTLPILAKVRFSRRLTEKDIFLLSMCWLTCVLMMDVAHGSEMGSRLWPCTVLLIDIALMCSLPLYMVNILVGSISLYVTVDAVERTSRFGLYDLAGGTKSTYLRNCFNLTDDQLVDAPCPEDFMNAVSVSALYLAVVCLNFICTHSFAIGIQREQKILGDNVHLAEKVVAALVRFDLEEAKDQLSKHKITKLTKVLDQMLHNLHQYRPYLPDALFDLSEKDNRMVSTVRPPSGGKVAIVFTDLKSTCAFWEASPNAMKHALQIHNKIIRFCISQFGGYEVKTIGDSFMVAFDNLLEGFLFAMAVQDTFAVTTWPSDLVLPREFEDNGWNGLMIRIGLNYGEVESEVSEIHGRTDYYGKTVNKAARLGAACIAGGVAIDSCCIHLIEPHEGCISKQITTIHLKGFEKPINISIYFPREFSVIPDHVSMIPTSRSSCSLDRGSTHQLFLTALEETSMVSKASATITKVEFVIPEGDYFRRLVDSAFEKAIVCLERTDGKIISVLSSSIVVGWNTTTNVSDHFRCGLRYVLLMYEAFLSPGDIYMGVSSGRIQCGKVGTESQRFVTVFGSCVNICGLLCQASHDLNVFALCTNCPTHFPFRPVDNWFLNEHERTIVYEIDVSRLKGWFCAEERFYKIKDKDNVRWGWGWGSDYVEAFDRGDWETINEQMSSDDEVLPKVSEMLRKGKSLRFLL